jgi:hypothetical protein
MDLLAGAFFFGFRLFGELLGFRCASPAFLALGGKDFFFFKWTQRPRNKNANPMDLLAGAGFFCFRLFRGLMSL